MIKLRYILAIILISPVGLFSQVSADRTGIMVLKGVVQTSGLTENDKTRFGINSDYQLITDSNPYFLVTDSDLSSYWGQCVEVSGTVHEGWEGYPKMDRNHFTFGRSAIVMNTILHANCGQTISGFNSNCIRDTITGTIVRGKRPAPDISYDYFIVPDHEVILRYEPMFDQRQFPLMHSLDIDTVNTYINAAISIDICGCFEGGYAEMTVFNLNHVLV